VNVFLGGIWDCAVGFVLGAKVDEGGDQFEVEIGAGFGIMWDDVDGAIGWDLGFFGRL
jgi:hypothetical protein